MRKNLKNQLRQLYSEIPEPNSINISETLKKTTEIVKKNKVKRLGFWEFYFQQFSFINKKIWLIQFIILLFCGIKIYFYSDEMQIIALISSIVPLIFLIGITEISKTYTYGTMELELSTKYTIKQIMMIRISIIGLIDILNITTLSFMIQNITSLKMYIVFLYICVPFMITCFGCLWILNKFKNKESNYYCFAFGSFVMAATSISITFLPTLYIKSLIWIWNIMLLISMIGVAIQVRNLINNCKNYESMNLTYS